MGTIRQLNGKWFVDLIIGGKRYRKVTGKSKRVAQLLLNDLELKAERQQLGIIERKDISPKKFFNEYLNFSVSNHRPPTQARYRAVIQHFLRFLDKECCNMTSLKSVSLEHIEKYKAFRRNESVPKNGQYANKNSPAKRGAKAYTVNFELKSLKTIFAYAINLGYLDANPAKGMVLLKTDDSKQRRFLSEDECKRLLAAAKPEEKLILATYMTTGMRRAELVNLEWSDIDLEQKTLKVQRKAFWLPKTGERVIPLVEGLVNALKQLPRESNFVFVDKKGGKLSMNKVRRIIISTAKAAGIPDLTQTHALRHSFASQLIMKGVDLPSVQRLMGHSQIATTMIYVHQTSEHLRSAISTIKLLN